MTDLLLLDYNGVVVNDEPMHFAALRDTLREEGITLEETTYFAEMLGCDDRACIRHALRRARGAGAAAETEVERLAARKAGRYAALTRAHLPLVPGAPRFVRDAARTARVAIVSGALRREIVAGLAQAGLEDCIAVIVSAEDVGASKPDPQGYRLAATRLAGDRDRVRVVVVEDSRPGLDAARALGAGCVALTTSHDADALAGADRIWASFDAHTPTELAPLFREVRLHADA
jgi:HAD superfamily hydrolase (TIGR01509 family)